MKKETFTVKTKKTQDLSSSFFQKSHELVFSQLGLSAREHDLFALFLSTLHSDHWKNFIAKKDISAPHYQFESEVLKDWFGLQAKQLYPTLKPVADRLSSRKVGIASDGSESFDFIPLFARIKYESGVLTIVPNSELISAYIDYSQGHAQIDHRVFRTLKTEYAKRLYSLFSRFKDTHATTLHPQSIKQLHGLLGLLDVNGKLTAKSYQQNKFFLERCIRRPIQEMAHCPEVQKELDILVDEKTGNLGFSPIYEGKKIIALKFLYRWKNPKWNPKSITETTLIHDVRHDVDDELSS